MCVYECFLNAKLMKNFYFQEMRGIFSLLHKNRKSTNKCKYVLQTQDDV